MKDKVIKLMKNKWFWIISIIIGTYLVFAKKKNWFPFKKKVDLASDNATVTESSKEVPLSTSDNSYDQNNPFGLIVSSSNWQGELPSGNKWEKFNTMENGIRAGIINLKNGYFNRGLDTIQEILNVYNKNANAGYFSHLEKSMGYNRNTPIPASENMKLAYYMATYESPRFANFISLTNFIEKYAHFLK